MNELNKPLGKKPETPATKNADGPKKLGLGVGLSLCLGATALGFIAYDRLTPKEEPIPPVVAKIEFEKEDEGATVLRETNNNVLVAEPIPKIEPLQEVETNGSIQVPTIKPTPSPRVIGQKKGYSHIPEKDLSEKGATGILPKLGNDGRRAMDVYAREPDTTGNFGVARVVIIVAGVGISQTSSQQAVRDLHPATTLAFAPYGNSLNRWMQTARKKGHEIILQLPMEPFGQANPGPHTLKSNAAAQENIANLHWSMSRITNYVGVMNYLGAKISADANALKPIFDDLAERGLFYLDDGTAGKSKTELAAALSVLPYAKAHIQIDETRTRREITKKLQALTVEAKRNGIAIGVANAFPETIALLAEYGKKAAESGIEITPLSAVVKDPQKN